jgi:hypothetical protein
MYEDHLTGKIYDLDEDAQKKYDEILDSYAELINDKYEISGKFK